MSNEEQSSTLEADAENPDENAMTLTINDVLEFEDDLIEQSAAVLGAANDKNCSYVEGYMKRQALYSCLTCIPAAKDDPEKAAGVCLACSYHCHEDHELIELYTKRNFRCDCGNSKFSNNFKCNLYNEKSEFNDLNAYNQNFNGTYCTCHRPYPDPEDNVQDDMIQCIICEDWYHSRHLNSIVPTCSFAEMICSGCVAKHDILLHYEAFCAKADEEDVEVEAAQPADEAAAATADAQIDEESDCKKPKDKLGKVSAKFWQEDSWRKELCTCDECLKLYENEDIAFLLDPEDPVYLYEEKGKAKARELAETEGNHMLNSLNRVQLVEFIHGYKDLQTNLSEYLKKFAEQKKVVREEDIKEFFEGMKARKRQRTEMPYYCH